MLFKNNIEQQVKQLKKKKNKFTKNEMTMVAVVVVVRFYCCYN